MRHLSTSPPRRRSLRLPVRVFRGGLDPPRRMHLPSPFWHPSRVREEQSPPEVFRLSALSARGDMRASRALPSSRFGCVRDSGPGVPHALRIGLAALFRVADQFSVVQGGPLGIPYAIYRSLLGKRPASAETVPWNGPISRGTKSRSNRSALPWSAPRAGGRLEKDGNG
ncbi:hypothetical protein ES707_15741 [subsurface metagenome]